MCGSISLHWPLSLAGGLQFGHVYFLPQRSKFVLPTKAGILGPFTVRYLSLSLTACRALPGSQGAPVFQRHCPARAPPISRLVPALQAPLIVRAQAELQTIPVEPAL